MSSAPGGTIPRWNTSQTFRYAIGLPPPGWRCVTLGRVASPLAQSACRGTESESPCPVCGAPLPREAAIRGRDRLLRTPGAFDVRVCAVCGSGVTFPIVAEDELEPFYRGGYGSHAEPTGGAYARASATLKRVQARMILRRAPFQDALRAGRGRALDVGCARGDLAAALLERGYSVDGIEPSAAAAAAAERRGVRVLGPSVARARLAGEAYDLIVLRHSLEHLPDPLGGLRELATALSREGRIVISIPNFASWQRSRFASRWFHLDLPRHRVHLNPSSLRVLLEHAGLRPRAQLSSTSVLGLPASVQYALIGRCLAPAGLRLRAAAALCCAAFPLTWLIDGAGGARDTLHTVAERAT